jgi:hypothetical protein
VPSLAVGRVPAGVDFGAPDGPATLVFLIAAPAGGDADHLTILGPWLVVGPRAFGHPYAPPTPAPSPAS